MLALVASPNSPEHIDLRDVPEPEPARDEVLVSVRSVSLNRGELNRLAQAQDGSRFGWDLGGEVLEPARDGTGPRAGTRVVGFVPGASWAQRVAVSTMRLAELPENVSFDDAASLPVAGLTALRTLRIGGLLVGRRVLITGGAGGVGRFAVQLARRAGAHVTAIAGGSERAIGLHELGAHQVLTDLTDPGGPFDLILESVGGSTLGQALTLVAAGGTVVTFGNSSREPTRFDVSAFYSRHLARLEAFLILAATQPQDFRADLGLLASLVGSGELDTQISTTVSWRQAGDALAALRERRVRGKAILQID